MRSLHRTKRNGGVHVNVQSSGRRQRDLVVNVRESQQFFQLLGGVVDMAFLAGALATRTTRRG
jgi:hypothetical protein